ncbi:outer membrane protein assembly factor BamA [Gammaproteobacteria bacterium LSUCC0057]|uniref:Outer membrane protein assembly factor BamA n=1 Tax=Gammaproteobacteria bacterium LSUCC0057 TaxID=2559237 RepID=A0A4Y8UM50_9GAMM|nr:outer membrane protein assembly factor BamA [Gammaproteobacteria bacterium LSUCC0057]
MISFLLSIKRLNKALLAAVKAVFLTLLLAQSGAASAEPFQVQDIRIEGLQRVSAGTVFAALPINVGDRVDEAGLQAATRALFSSGYFSDVVIARDGGVLVLGLVERPAVAEIVIEGNKAIETEQLLSALRDNGLAEGQIFRQVVLDGMGQELQRQYVSQGRYGAMVETEVEQLPRNRIKINVTIDEGDVALIRHINIVGNRAFEQEQLLELFEQQATGGWFSWFSSDDKYAREKLSGDIDSLESWYLDRGYLKFQVRSTQVSVSPDKTSVYITINIDEGDIYKVGKVELAGELVIPEEQIRQLILMREGMTFSQALMTSSSEFITRRLGNDGYTFAEVKGYPDVDEETGTAKVTFLVTPGMRAYVRRIEFRGNSKTADEVLRREMRQMEGGSANTALIEHSKLRLERLGFFKEVNSETVPVPGTSDQIDVIYTVEEQPSGSVGASLGYAQGTGMIIGANLSENNFLGSGKQVAIGLNRSRYQTSVNLSYTEPYYTVDGVSLGFNIFARETDYGDFQLSDYSTSSYGAGLNWGYPLSEVSRVGFGVGYEHLDMGSSANSSTLEVREFIATNGDMYDMATVNLSYVRSTLNRGVFATRGTQLRAGLEATVPGSDLEYWRANLSGQYLTAMPIFNRLTLKFSAELGVGDGYGDTGSLPFFKNYYGGGLGSIRGFERNDLGPRGTRISGSGDPKDWRSLGGNIKVVGGLDIIFPLPFLKDQRSVQSSLFVDGGNIFNSSCNGVQLNCYEPSVSDMRFAAGVGVTWLSGFGPLTFSLSKPFNASEYENKEVFQFSMGNTF